jgi:hypothetical protein
MEYDTLYARSRKTKLLPPLFYSSKNIISSLWQVCQDTRAFLSNYAARASGWCQPQEHSPPVNSDIPRTIRYALERLDLGVAGVGAGLVPAHKGGFVLARSTNVVRAFSPAHGQNGTTSKGRTAIGSETQGVGPVRGRRGGDEPRHYIIG